MFLLFKHRVATLDRKSFRQIGSEGKHFLRVSIATGIEDLREGLEQIANAVHDKEGFKAYVEEGNKLF
jgi:bifunctional pyridoxal-dependent enzyme with beta-cystathionase and maltose regulon repressor activities